MCRSGRRGKGRMVKPSIQNISRCEMLPVQWICRKTVVKIKYRYRSIVKYSIAAMKLDVIPTIKVPMYCRITLRYRSCNGIGCKDYRAASIQKNFVKL